MKREVSLIFPYYDSIRCFLYETHTWNFSVVPSMNLIRCVCTDSEIELATSKYNAHLAEGNGFNPSNE